MNDPNALDESVLGPYLARHIDGFGTLTIQAIEPLLEAA